VLGRVVVEGEQLVEIVDDLRDGFAELGAVGQLERGDGTAGVEGRRLARWRWSTVGPGAFAVAVPAVSRQVVPPR
jgi:hypothetical protein